MEIRRGVLKIRWHKKQEPGSIYIFFFFWESAEEEWNVKSSGVELS